MPETIPLPTLRFTEADAHRAFREFGCNCGPSALAAILGKTLEEIRPAVETVGFAEKRYMSPTMMAKAIPLAGGQITARHVHNATAPRTLRWPQAGLVRIQWTGPWTAPGSNPKWAYRQTHWVASWKEPADPEPLLFDVNAGRIWLSNWTAHIVPLLTGAIPRADGGWYVSHSWEITPANRTGAT